MDENEIYEALGVTPPQTKTPAEDEPEQEASDENGSAAAESAAGGGQEDEPEAQEEIPSSGAGKEQEETASDSAMGVSSPHTELNSSRPDSASAEQEARWKTLTDQAVSRALEEERARNKKQWDAFFSSAGLKNNLDGGKPITSLEEFQAWKTRFDRMRLERDLKDGKLTPEAFEAAIRAEVEKMSGKPLPETGSQDAGGGEPTDYAAGGTSSAHRPSPQVSQTQIDAELAEIHRLDGSVSGLEDILKMETGGAFREAVYRGHSFLDAFKLANFDRLQSARQSEAARRSAQAARNSARSKEHLRASGGSGKEGAVAVPGDVMEVYRLLMPKASEADILAHYNRTMKELKK